MKAAKNVTAKAPSASKVSALERIMAEIAIVQDDLHILESGVASKVGELNATLEPHFKKMIQQRRELIVVLGDAQFDSRVGRRRKRSLRDLARCIAASARTRFDADLQDELRKCGFLNEEDAEEEDDEELSIPEDFYSEREDRIRTYIPDDSNPVSRRKAEPVDPAALHKRIYHGLARELHPDKANDSSEHAERTNLMQKLNVAYEAADTRTLLDLLHRHGSEQAKSGLDAPTMRALQSTMEDQLRGLHQRLQEKLAKMPKISCGWLQALRRPELWAMTMKREVNLAKQEVSRVNRLAEFIRSSGGVDAFLAETDEKDWAEMF